MLGLYVHIPFCAQKCRYCDFLSFGGHTERGMEDYMSLLCAEIGMLPRQVEKLSSVFIGGGTPSALPERLMVQLLNTVRQRFDLTGAEITAEANPGTVDEKKLTAWRKAGINRLSLGVQSFDDGELKRIGRIHSANQAVEAFRMARNAGFSNINVDLMYGLPGQSAVSCLCSLEKAIALQPEHISFYALILEEGTPLYTDVTEGLETLPDEDETAETGDAGARLLQTAGYERYEVSNYAQPGRRCRHNLLYWQGGDYLAAGLGASFALWQGGTLIRGENAANMRDYAAMVRSNLRPVANTIVEEGKDAMFTFAMMGLRLKEGFSAQEFERRFQTDFASAFPKTAKHPLLCMSTDSVRLTVRGFDLMNAVLVGMMDEM
ncbi:MAG: radical SAM family heme chaperone HemW [Christensenellales bacterium]|jgi:oxygen-independent coproporphyrinogen-3 oxidase